MRKNDESMPTARKENIVVKEIRQETLVYDLTSNRAVCLNQTSALAWHCCDGRNSIEGIIKKMSSVLRHDISEEFVWLALDQLNTEGLLENYELPTSPFAGISRRNLIRNIGFASAIALPLVSSIVAPRSIGAQSCGDIFQACQAFPDTCCPGRDCIGYGPSSPGQCCFDDGSIPPDGPPRNPGTHCTQQVHCVSQFCCSGNATLGDTNISCPTGAIPGVPCICS